MSHLLPLGFLTCTAGLGLAVLAAADNLPRSQDVFVDPVLSGAARLCRPEANGSANLLSHYKKVAAKTETGPFSTGAGSSRSAGRDTPDTPLFANLGTLTYTITTASPLAQRYFDQGLRLAYAFNHAEARRAFRAAHKHDPECAMCYWGEALVLGPNINAPMDAAAVAPAIAAIRQAETKAASASVREQALIAALGKRYAEGTAADRSHLDAAYAQAMGEIARRFPDDQTINVLHAEALMDLTPWDYWDTGGTKAKGKTDEIIATLEKVLSKNPDHPGAIHFYIHMVEASATPERALPFARRLAAAMPGAGHLVHMPFHVHFRLGDYRAALEANKAAVAADEAYIAKAEPHGLYPAAYYPHNVHSLMVSAQMAGDGDAAVAAAAKLARVVTAEAGRTIPWVQPIQMAPYFAHAQFSTPTTILALPDPGDGLPLVKAMWHYARGTAHAAGRDIAAAALEAAAIAQLKGSNFADLSAGGIPATDILELARQVVLARIAIADGKRETALTAFEQAVAIQDKLPYSEPPHWYYPVRQSLGAVLVRMGRLDAAEEAFRASLAQSPNNGWALHGLGEVYRRTGRSYELTEANRRLDKAWAGDRGRLDLARF